jgi:shikimate dehydrogenase
MRFRSSLIGSFADPADDNPTVVMMEAAFQAAGLDWRYINCRVAKDALREAVAGARAMGWAGFNLSMPHKLAVVGLLDELQPAAKLTGAVNFVDIGKDGRLTGDNTDGDGFVEGLLPYRAVSGSTMLVLGTGGAARAIVASAAAQGLGRLFVCGRSPASVAALVELAGHAGLSHIGVLPWSEAIRIPAQVDVVLNATPLGMPPFDGAAPPLDWSSVAANTLIADVALSRGRTQLLMTASSYGCTVVDGLSMLVGQGARNFERWTGSQPDRSVMTAALHTVLEAPQPDGVESDSLGAGGRFLVTRRGTADPT